MSNILLVLLNLFSEILDLPYLPQLNFIPINVSNPVSGL